MPGCGGASSQKGLCNQKEGGNPGGKKTKERDGGGPGETSSPEALVYSRREGKKELRRTESDVGGGEEVAGRGQARTQKRQWTDPGGFTRAGKPDGIF